MKKSQIYTAAMLAVMEDSRMVPTTKLEIIEQLMEDKHLAEFCEKNEGEKNNVQ